MDHHKCSYMANRLMGNITIKVDTRKIMDYFYSVHFANDRCRVPIEEARLMRKAIDIKFPFDLFRKLQCKTLMCLDDISAIQ